MNLKLRLTLVSFFQFFVWGAWLITIATYFFSNGMGTGAQFGAIFSTLAISSLIMPALTGIIADRWMNAEGCTESCIFCMGPYCFIFLR